MALQNNSSWSVPSNFSKSLFFLLITLSSCSEKMVDEPYCDNSPEIISGDEITSLSFSTESVLQAISGQWECDLTWNGAGEIAEVTPSEGTTEVSMSLSYEGGEIRDIVSVKKGGHKYDRLSCSNRLEISSVLEMRSSDGALAEAWDVQAGMLAKYEMSIVFFDPIFKGSYRYELAKEWPYTWTVLSVIFYIEDFKGVAAEGKLVELTSDEEQTVFDEELMTDVVENTGTIVATAKWECLSRR